MALLAYNLTGAAVALASGNPVRTIPASAAPPARGPSFNVTSELRPNLTVDPARGVAGGLTGANFVSLQAQVTAGSLVFEWTSEPEYLTTGLTCISSATIANLVDDAGGVRIPTNNKAYKGTTALGAAQDLVKLGPNGEVLVGGGNTAYVDLCTNTGSAKVRAENDGSLRLLTNNIPLQGTTVGNLPQDLIKLGPTGEVLVGGGNTNYVGFCTNTGTEKVRTENDGGMRILTNNMPLRGTTADLVPVPLDMIRVGPSGEVLIGGLNVTFIGFVTQDGNVHGMVANDGALQVSKDKQQGPTIFGGDVDITRNDSCGSGIASYNNATIYGPFHYAARYRGTKAAPAAVQAEDILLDVGCTGYDGTNPADGGDLVFVVDGPVSAGVVPTRVEQWITDLAGAYKLGMVVKANGKMGVGVADPKSALHMNLADIPVYADNAAALLGGLTAGAIYRTGADPDPICVVH